MALLRLELSDSPFPMDRQLCTGGSDDLTRVSALLRSPGLQIKMLSPGQMKGKRSVYT